MSFLTRLFGRRDGNEEKTVDYLLVECMYDAIRADGVIHEAELSVLDKTARDHDYFRALPQDLFERLVARAAAETRQGKTRKQRMDFLAEHLPGRSHRLAAYALACEVCAADGQVDDSEVSYLEDLARAFMLKAEIAEEILLDAKKARGLARAETAHEDAKTLAPAFLRCMVLVASADGVLEESETSAIRRVASRLSDLPSSRSVLDAMIAEDTDAARYSNVEQELAGLARSALTRTEDRYWALVYMAAVAASDGATDWREAKLLETARTCFAIDDAAYEAALGVAASLWPGTE